MSRTAFTRDRVKDTPLDPDKELRATLRRYSVAHPCHGLRRAHAYLVHDVGREINLKKSQRLWCEEGLTLKTPRKEVRRGKTTTPLVKATCPNHVWSIDFQYDVTRNGRPVKIVSMIDEFTRESPIGMIERSVDADALAKALSAVIALRGTPGCCVWITAQNSSPNACNACAARVLAWHSSLQVCPGTTGMSNHLTTAAEGSAYDATTLLTS